MTNKLTISLLCLGVLAVQLQAADSANVSGPSDSTAPAAASGPPASGTAASGAAASGSAASKTATSEDLKQLQERMAKQEEEIKQLQQSLAEEHALLEKAVQSLNAAPSAVKTVNTANVTSGGVPILPAVNVTRPRGVAMQKSETQASPLGISIGNTTFTPLGFVDATFYGRSTNVGSGIGTNFAGIPFNNVATGHISEMNFSTQNSRLGFRVDSTVLGGKVLGYFEADFLGQDGGNVFVTSNANTFRMRNVFVDWQKNGFEFLGGQDWSFATPNRRGLSPLPADIFYGQVMDTNYQAGLVWARQTQFRFIAHPSENLAFGVSLENPQQYVGGSGGLSATAVTPPAAPGLSALFGTQLNNGSNTFNSANLHPDIIFKGAYDAHVHKDQIMHVEAGAIVRTFKVSFPLGTAPVTFPSHSATAGSGFVNANLEVVKGFRLIANTFFGSGNGRYVFGLSPDLIVRADGSLSPVHTYSTVDGFEAQVAKNTLFYGYYGGVYIGRNVAVDANGKSLIGYGYTGSANSANRTIQEGSIGIIQTFWKNPSYGSLSLITQYSYLLRNPWYVAAGAPKATHTNMYWIDLRYTLP